MRRRSILMIGSVLWLGVVVWAQDSPSLGDAARKARQLKQVKATRSSDDSAPPKVITNEQIPEHPEESANGAEREGDHPGVSPQAGDQKLSAAEWKSEILAQKDRVAAQEKQMQRLNDSIHYASGNCVRGCVQWNERQQQKQEEVDRMKAQIQEQKQRLDEMQEAARQQGYGSSVYEP